jgi:hypothetical protein
MSRFDSTTIRCAGFDCGYKTARDTGRTEAGWEPDEATVRSEMENTYNIPYESEAADVFRDGIERGWQAAQSKMREKGVDF